MGTPGRLWGLSKGDSGFGHSRETGHSKKTLGLGRALQESLGWAIEGVSSGISGVGHSRESLGVRARRRVELKI